MSFLFLQNKEFVCRGYDYERLEDFQQRMLGEFPQAIAMQHPNIPDDTILQSDAQCILAVSLWLKQLHYFFFRVRDHYNISPQMFILHWVIRKAVTRFILHFCLVDLMTWKAERLLHVLCILLAFDYSAKHLSVVIRGYYRLNIELNTEVDFQGHTGKTKALSKYFFWTSPLLFLLSEYACMSDFVCHFLDTWLLDLQIYAVTPVSDISDVPQLERVPERIKSFYRINNVSRFHYDRPFHKGPKDRENEFRVRWARSASSAHFWLTV